MQSFVVAQVDEDFSHQSAVKKCNKALRTKLRRMLRNITHLGVIANASVFRGCFIIGNVCNHVPKYRQSVEAYSKYIKRNRNYGDEMAVVAFTRAFHVKVFVQSYRRVTGDDAEKEDYKVGYNAPEDEHRDVPHFVVRNTHTDDTNDDPRELASHYTAVVGGRNYATVGNGNCLFDALRIGMQAGCNIRPTDDDENYAKKVLSMLQYHKQRLLSQYPDASSTMAVVAELDTVMEHIQTSSLAPCTVFSPPPPTLLPSIAPLPNQLVYESTLPILPRPAPSPAPAQMHPRAQPPQPSQQPSSLPLTNAPALVAVDVQKQQQQSTYTASNVPTALAHLSTNTCKPSAAVTKLLDTKGVQLDDHVTRTHVPEVFFKNTSRRTTIARRRLILQKVDDGTLTWRMLLCGSIVYEHPTKGTTMYTVGDWEYDTAPDKKVKSHGKKRRAESAFGFSDFSRQNASKHVCV